MFYIIYLIKNINNGKIYIGAHKTTNKNDKYMGSGRQLKKAMKEEGVENFSKEILFEFNSEEEMLLKESELVNRDFINREDTYNVMIGGGAFYSSGMTICKDKNENNFLISNKDKRFLSGEYISIHKGTTLVIDKNGKKFRVKNNDPKFLSGELIHITKNKITVKDKFGNTFNIDKNDPRFLSGELRHCTKGQVTVRDKFGNTFNVNKNDPRYLSGELKYILCGKITVKDSNGNILKVDKNDPRYLSGELIKYKRTLNKC